MRSADPGPSSGPAIDTTTVGTAALDVGALEARLLEILGGDRSLQDAATAVHDSLAAHFPAARPSLEIVRSPIELSVEYAPSLPPGFVAAAYPMSLAARDASLAVRAVNGLAPLYEHGLGGPAAGAPGGSPFGDLARGFGLAASCSSPALRGDRALGAITLYVEHDAASGGAAAAPQPDRDAKRVFERHAALWALCLEGVLRGRALLADVRSWRQDLAAEIHDDALQSLIAVDLRLQRLTAHLAEPVFTQLLGEVRATCSDAVGGLRAMLARLEPASDAIAVQPAALIERLATTSLDPLGVLWRVHDELDVPVRPATGQLLAAILAELVLDCTRQPRPTELDLSIGGDQRQLQVRLRRVPGTEAAPDARPWSRPGDATASGGAAPAGEDHRHWAAARALCALSGGTFAVTEDRASSEVTVQLPLLG